jgi:hypothetical protein
MSPSKNRKLHSQALRDSAGVLAGMNVSLMWNSVGFYQVRLVYDLAETAQESNYESDSKSEHIRRSCKGQVQLLAGKRVKRSDVGRF